MLMSLIVSLIFHSAELANVWADKRQILELRYDLSNIPEAKFRAIPAGGNGLPYFCAYLKIEFHLEGSLNVRITHNGEELAAVTAEYN